VPFRRVGEILPPCRSGLVPSLIARGDSEPRREQIRLMTPLVLDFTVFHGEFEMKTHSSRVPHLAERQSYPLNHVTRMVIRPMNPCRI
jgi:hypothetical protein